MLIKRYAIALGLFLAVSAPGARAEDAPPAPPAGCSVGSTNFLTQNKDDAKGDVKGDLTIDCSGLTEAFGKQLADVLTRILQNRLDPQMVLLKLDEVDRVPEESVARTVDDTQRQLIIHNLIEKPAGQIAITAHPAVEDSAEFAKALATPLLMVGWQIDGHEIRRAAPKALEPVHGVALIVRDRDAAPEKALLLKAALAAAHIAASLVSNSAMMPDDILLWIGRRPEFMPTDAAK
jgi:hypothetical protein